DEMKRRGMLTEQQYAKAARSAALTVEQSYLDTASAVGHAVAGIFQKSKAAQLASAIIDAYAAFNKALANPPRPPHTIPLAAAALASGLARVAAIRSTNIGSSSASGGGDSATPQPVAAAPIAQNQTITVTGITPSSLFTGDSVKELIGAFNVAIKD